MPRVKKAKPKVEAPKQPAPEPEPEEPAPPVQVDNKTRRNDDDALTHGFVMVHSGPHKGRYGVIERVTSHGVDGYPEHVTFRTRDDQAEFLLVKHEDLRPAEAGLR